jgi:hypothetical protein
MPDTMDAPAFEIVEDPTRPANIFCTHDKLAILGTAETMLATPWEDEEFEIWAVAQCETYPAFKRADILFELHTKDYWSDPNVIVRLNRWKGPMVMQDHYEEVPNSIRLPLEVVKNYRRYHRTSITYMLTLAYHSYLLTKKPAHVALFGVHMADIREEYAEQRPCCEYWLGRMEGAGMDIFLAGGALLQAPFMYGYEKYNPLTWKLRSRLDGLVNGQGVREQEEREAELKKHEQMGAVKEVEYWLRLAQRGELTLEQIGKEIADAEKETK